MEERKKERENERHEEQKCKCKGKRERGGIKETDRGEKERIWKKQEKNINENAGEREK